MKNSATKIKSVVLPMYLSRGTRIFVQVASKFPYTVLYNEKGPVKKRVIAVIDNDEPVITITSRLDVRFLLLVGSVDETAWKATKQALDSGIDPGAPGTAMDTNGMIS